MGDFKDYSFACYGVLIQEVVTVLGQELLHYNICMLEFTKNVLIKSSKNLYFFCEKNCIFLTNVL